MRELAVLWIGPVPGDELVAALDESAALAGLRQVNDLESACRLLSSLPAPPDLAVLLQSHPGEYPSASIEELRRLAPLMRIERVLGSWCEGEARSGKPPVGASGCYWHQWPARFAQQLARATAGEVTAWDLPLTASPEERALTMLSNVPTARDGLMTVCASRAANAAALADACAGAGYRTKVVRETDPFDASGALALLWDTVPARMVQPNLVEGLPRGAPIIALVSFPREEDVRHARAAGIAAVVSKPYTIHDLCRQLDRLQIVRS